MIKNDIIKLNCWNIKETSFGIDYGIVQLVVIFHLINFFKMISPDNRNSINLVKYISSVSETNSSILHISMVNIIS